jgi:diaminopimelate epimerase
MKIKFSKYQATGNDFVIVDNRSMGLSFNTDQVKKICDRRFGIGADGLMLIESHPTDNFNLVYYNSDGSQSLCGNGSRAAVQFARTLGLLDTKTAFNAFDGSHEATIGPDGTVHLRMNDVHVIRPIGQDYFIDTGSPHYIRFVTAVMDFPVVDAGREIRYDRSFEPGGTNVNFVELLPDNEIFVRTYERGVENETLSCGTGVTAAAIAASFKGYRSPVKIRTLGGILSVEFAASARVFTDVYLVGPAKMVFTGELEL